MTNWHRSEEAMDLSIESARWRKVAHLLAALYLHGLPPARARRFGRRQLAVVARAARVNAPSDDTIQLLRETLRSVVPPPTDPETAKD